MSKSNESEDTAALRSRSSKSSSLVSNCYYAQRHSTTSCNSSSATNQQQHPKCSNCLIWQNLYKIFEFLATGRLNQLRLDLSLGSYNQETSGYWSEKFESLARIVHHATKSPLKNPIDPSDSADWLWDYRSPKNYKLLKLKLKLINQSEQLIKLSALSANAQQTLVCI